MGKYAILLWCVIIVLIGAACADSGRSSNSGPRLVQEVTIAATDPLPTRILSPTPSPIRATAEQVSPLEVATVEADFVLVTPTLPPSKTPTLTPTSTLTPTVTRTPTVTVTNTAIAPQFPTSVIIAVTAPVPQPLPQVCDSTWFFIQPRPNNCPLSPPISGQGVYQEFQNGYMIWVQQQDTIYVLYNDPALPRWQVFIDQFEEGMPEDDPAYADAPTPNTWQPRRGFGLLWRTNALVRQRIGWATQEWEQPYSTQLQRAKDGTTFILAPGGVVFSLARGGGSWQRFVGATGVFGN